MSNPRIINGEHTYYTAVLQNSLHFFMIFKNNLTLLKPLSIFKNKKKRKSVALQFRRSKTTEVVAARWQYRGPCG